MYGILNTTESNVGKLSIEELRERIANKEAADPIVLLESLSTGFDPRRTSQIYTLVEELNEFNDGVPSKSDWEEILKLVRSRYKSETVYIETSMSAAKTLAEYLYSKKNRIDISGSHTFDDASAVPLTEEEIQLFKEVWNDEF